MFETSRQALAFALNRDSSGVTAPLQNKYANMLDERQGVTTTNFDRERLSKMDASGQAGFILFFLNTLISEQKDAATASAARATFPCSCRSPCCMGVKPNPLWADSIRRITGYVGAEMHRRQAEQKKKTVIHPVLLRKLVEKYYGIRYMLGDLAEQFDLTENTLTNYKKPVWLILDDLTKDAFTNLDNLLVPAGLVGGSEETAKSL